MTAIRNISIKLRLTGLVILALAIIFFIGAFSVVKLNQLSTNGIKMRASSQDVVRGLQLTRDIGELRRLTSAFLTSGEQDAFNAVLRVAKKIESSIPKGQRAQLDAFLKDMKTLSVRMESFRSNKVLVHEAETNIVQGLNKSFSSCKGDDTCQAALEATMDGLRQYLPLGASVLEDFNLANSSKVTEIVDAVTLQLGRAAKSYSGSGATQDALKSLQNAFYDLDDALSTIVAIEKKVQASREGVLKKLGIVDQAVMKASIDSGNAASLLAEAGEGIARRAFTITVVIGALSLVVFLLLGYVFSQSIIVPLSKITKLLEVMAKGDLRNRLELQGNDELTQVAQSFNTFLDNISALVGHVKRASESVGQEATKLDQASHKMVKEAIQAVEVSKDANAQIEEVADYMNQTTTMVDNLAQATNEIASNTANTASLSENLGVQVQDTKNVIQELSEHAKSIGDVIGLIGSIAEQTNLLALNATIEAARAGEAGKGFAVVANEVKELAKQTQEATEKIAPIISSIQKSVDQSVASINESVSAMDVLKDSANTVAAAVEEQTATYSEINEQVQVINERIQSVKEKVEILATASHENLTESEQIKERGSVLKQDSEELNVQIAGLVV